MLCFGPRECFHELVAGYAGLSEECCQLEREAAKNRRLIWSMDISKGDRVSVISVKFSAWDMSQFIRLTLRGSTAGYINEEEAADLIGLAAMQVQQEFMSWKEFSQDFLKARRFWCAGDAEKQAEHQKYVEIVKVLLEDDNSPWRYIDWNKKLPESDFIVVSIFDQLGLIKPGDYENQKNSGSVGDSC